MTDPTQGTAQAGDLFDAAHAANLEGVLRTVDAATFEGEIRLRIDEVKDRVKKLEQAQVVSQELLDTVISV